jgi:hypothetical protein
MTVVSSKEFVANEDKYFELAMEEQICVQKDGNLFYLSGVPVEMHWPEQPVLEPDDDLRRAITMDEFRKRAREVVEKAYKRHLNESNYIAGGARVS